MDAACDGAAHDSDEDNHLQLLQDATLTHTQLHTPCPSQIPE